VRKPSRPQEHQAIAVGIAWFDRAQWQQLTQVVADRNELDDTFEQWEQNALDALRMIKRQGYRVEKVYVDVDSLLSWCKAKGLPVNGESRAEYVSNVLRERHKSDQG